MFTHRGQLDASAESSAARQDVPAWLAQDAPAGAQAETERVAVSGLADDTLALGALPQMDMGTTVTLTASGADDGARVFFLIGQYSEDHACPAALGGRCMDLNMANSRILGSALADASGAVTLDVSVPNTARVQTLIDEGYAPYVQAIQAMAPMVSEATPVHVCNSTMSCAEVVTCIDGLAYPTACGADNCDDSIGSCGDACDDIVISGGTCEVCDTDTCIEVTCDDGYAPTDDGSACLPQCPEITDDNLHTLVNACLDEDGTGDCPLFAAASGCGDMSTWDVSAVTDMTYLFEDRVLFDHDISAWDTSSVTTMYAMFYHAETFNQPIGGWNVSALEDASYLFDDAYLFNQPLNAWDVSSVTDMRGMFDEALAFNQPLDTWDVQNVTSMIGMFYHAETFDQPLNMWDIGSVTNMAYLFSDAYVFNQPLAAWDVSGVERFDAMFDEATAFDQDILYWDLSSATDVSDMFYDATATNCAVTGEDGSYNLDCYVGGDCDDASCSDEGVCTTLICPDGSLTPMAT